MGGNLKKYKRLVEEQLPDIPSSNILLEPCMRNTAPCIAYAGWKIKSRNPRAAIVVTPSDHVVTNLPEFRRVINRSLDFVTNNDAILTLGMKPTRPETGYGYIAECTENPCNREICRVESFREKPSPRSGPAVCGRWSLLLEFGALLMECRHARKGIQRLLPVHSRDIRWAGPCILYRRRTSCSR